MIGNILASMALASAAFIGGGGGGGGTLVNLHGAHITRAAAQTIPSQSRTTIAYDTEVFDHGDIASGGSVTIKSAGRYYVTTGWLTPGLSDNTQAEIIVDGTRIARGGIGFPPDTTASAWTSTARVLDLGVGQVITGSVYVDDGGNTATDTEDRPFLIVMQLYAADAGPPAFDGDLAGNTLRDSTDSLVNVAGDIVPTTDGTGNLGTGPLRFDAVRAFRQELYGAGLTTYASAAVDLQGTSGLVNNGAANGGDVFIDDGLRVTGSISNPGGSVVVNDQLSVSSSIRKDGPDPLIVSDNLEVQGTIDSEDARGSLAFSDTGTTPSVIITTSYQTFGQGTPVGCNSAMTCTGATGVLSPSQDGDYLISFSSSFARVGGGSADMQCAIFVNTTEQTLCRVRVTLASADTVAGDKTCILPGITGGDDITLQCRRISGADFTLEVYESNTTLRRIGG